MKHYFENLAGKSLVVRHIYITVIIEERKTGNIKLCIQSRYYERIPGFGKNLDHALVWINIHSPLFN